MVYSPLRISPLGAHIDHQDGCVTGMTLNQVILLAFVPRADRHVCVESLNFAHRVEFDLDNVPPRSPGDWGNYVRGAVLSLREKYTLRVGMDAIVEGEMPIGGLSSSAAVGVAYLLALESANDLCVSPQENIQHDRYIENTYLGLHNGILDPAVILMSDHDHLTFLDCRSVEFQKFASPSINGRMGIMIVYSGLVKSLTGTDYNRRVSECQEAARLMLEWSGQPAPTLPRLRMVSPDVYAEVGHRLPPPLDRRARHFFGEMERVQQGMQAWRSGDLDRLGQLINESGYSSVHYYESGCPHMITLYRILSECPGVYGARFSGAGFRGSCLALIDPARDDEIKAAIDAQYPQAHPDVADLYSVHLCQPDGPARLWNGKK